MAPDHELDERLIRPILHAADDAQAPGDHPDEETLALFAQGALVGAERSALVEHLAGCAECRQTASLVVALPETSQSGATTSEVFPLRHRLGWTWTLPAGLAAAATILLALVAWRLAEPARRSAEPIALAYAGRLTDFGFEIGGTAAREAGKPGAGLAARQILKRTAGRNDLNSELNRGYALLVLGNPREARSEFAKAARRAPGEPMAWLGQGIAAFALDDFEAAESAFRACLRLDSRNVAARLNLAMALEERGALDEALAEWRALLAEPLSEADRRAVIAEIEQLRRQRPGR